MANVYGTDWQCVFNTLRPRQDGQQFPEDIFKCIFLNENVWISIKISLKFFVPKGPINKIPTLVQIMAWPRSGNKPLSETMLVYWHIYVSLGLNELNHGTMNDWVTAGLDHTTGLILDLRPVNERHRYKVTAFLIGWEQTQNQPWYKVAVGSQEPLDLRSSP